jgi:DNA polymerase IV
MERRLNRAGIYDMPSLWALDARQMRCIWGSVWGEKLWYLLRGAELPEEETTRRTVGHSHVLAPELRANDKANYVARRLVMKASARLRRMGYVAGVISLSIRSEQGSRYEASARCHPAQDSYSFLHLLESLWQHVLTQAATEQRQSAAMLRVKKVSVVLHGLQPVDGVQQELFSPIDEAESKSRVRAEKISRALDRINQRYGRDSVLIGMLPSQGKTFSGTKIAFTRIPDVQEFWE